MMSKWRFGATNATSGLTCSAGMSVVAVALLVAVGCGGELANTPTSPAIEEFDNLVASVFSMSGQAFDAETGDAIEGVMVSVEGDIGRAEAFTDPNGGYRFEGLGGVVVIHARARGYRLTEGVTVRMDRDIQLDIQLAPETREGGYRIPLRQQ